MLNLADGYTGVETKIFRNRRKGMICNIRIYFKAYVLYDLKDLHEPRVKYSLCLYTSRF